LFVKFSGRGDVARAAAEVADESRRDLGNYDAAQSLYEKLLATYPESSQAMRAQRGIVNIDIKAGNYEAAEAGIETLLTKYADHDDLPQAFYWLGNDYFDARQYDEAGECYQYVIDNRPESNAAMSSWAGIGRVHVRRGDDEAAEDVIDKIIADFNDNPGVAEGLSSLGEQYFYKKDYGKAIDIWELILSKYPGEGPDLVPYLLATSYERLKVYRTAIAYYEQTLAEYPNCKYAYRVPYRLGIMYRRVKDYEQSVYWFGRQGELYSHRNTAQRALFFKGVGVPGRAHLLGGESPLWTRQREPLAGRQGCQS
jgi:tetratricopeptide (TPR) repeat protein